MGKCDDAIVCNMKDSDLLRRSVPVVGAFGAEIRALRIPKWRRRVMMAKARTDGESTVRTVSCEDGPPQTEESHQQYIANSWALQAKGTVS